MGRFAPHRLVDIFPTLAQLCGVPTEGLLYPLEGVSLVPLLHQPNRSWERMAFTQYVLTRRHATACMLVHKRMRA